MLNQSASVFNSSSLYLPKGLPILQKCGRVNTHVKYTGLDTQGEFTSYEVKRGVASIVAQGVTFAQCPYAFFQPVGEQDGWQLFQAECGEAMIPVNDYHRLLSVSKRTANGKKINNQSSDRGNRPQKEGTMSHRKITWPTALNLSPDQISRVRSFMLNQTDSIAGLLTDEQKRAAAAILDGMDLWVDNLAGVFRSLEDGRIMLFPDPSHREKISQWPRLRFLADRGRITANFEPVDMTNDDWKLIRTLEPTHLIALKIPYAAA